jgi:carbamate kinase
MKLVVAVGGRALLRRAQAPSMTNLLNNVRQVANQLAQMANACEHGRFVHQIVLTHGSAPQVGLLALQAACYAAQNPGTESAPIDMLDAEVAGLLGYTFEQEIANLLPATRTVACLLTRVEVDRFDPAFDSPSKAIGPTYSRELANQVLATRPWAMGPEVGAGGGLRRLVASPRPVRVLAMAAIRDLLRTGALVIAGGGGGIPVTLRADCKGMEGVEAVVDKDLSSALIATGLEADCLIIATDVDAVYANWGQPEQRRIGNTTSQALESMTFAPGSMAPKVEAALNFVKATGQRAVIGPIDHIEDMLAGRVGTQITR